MRFVIHFTATVLVAICSLGSEADRRLVVSEPQGIFQFSLIEGGLIHVDYDGRTIFYFPGGERVVLPDGIFIEQVALSNKKDAAVLLMRDRLIGGGSNYYGLALISMPRDAGNFEISYALFSPQLFLENGARATVSRIEEVKSLGEAYLRVGRAKSIDSGKITYKTEKWDLVTGQLLK